MVAVVITPRSFGEREEAAAAVAASEAAAIGAECILVARGDRGRAGRFAAERGLRLIEIAPDAPFGVAANAGVAATQADRLAILGAVDLTGATALTGALALLAGPEVAVVGPRVVEADGSAEACGFATFADPTALAGFRLNPFGGVTGRMACDAFRDDALVTTRAVYERLGGFAEDLGDADAAVDYCLRAAQTLGLRVLFEPSFVVRRLPRTGEAPHRRASHHARAFAKRWRGRVQTHENAWPERLRFLAHPNVLAETHVSDVLPMPPVTVVVHGDAEEPPEPFMECLRRTRLTPETILWAASGSVPEGARRTSGDLIAQLRGASERRSMGYLAFVRRDTVLAPDWLNELFMAVESDVSLAAATATEPADGRCTLVAPHMFPQHLRIEPAASVDAAVATWLDAAVGVGRSIAHAPRAVVSAGAPAARARVEPPSPVEPFVTIVMLSWNAPEYTEIAVASIRRNTPVPHEIVIVDNGSAPSTVARIRALGVRLIENAVNTGFAFACNQGLAAARGTHIVLLNNDVLVPSGWLEPLLAVQRRNPVVGCSAPRTNNISGPQQLGDVPYHSTVAMPLYAEERARTFRGQWTNAVRVAGFCMCLSRAVVDEIGGFDPSYRIGNFEDDDYCIRIRAAGYEMAVCEDSFIHHFGSITFIANNVDRAEALRRNRERFDQKWGVQFEGDTYKPDFLWRRGFIRERDYVPLPAPVGVGPDWTLP